MIETRRHPRLKRRFQAFLIDSIIIALFFFAAAALLARIDMHGGIKAGLVALVILALEPGLVSATGATIGHHLRNLRVEDAVSAGNLNFVQAMIRFVIKTVLGIPSFIFVMVTRRHQAIHDLASGSIVILRNPDRHSSGQVLVERVEDHENYIYPSKMKRIIFILGYGVLSLVFFSIFSAALISDDCFYSENLCSTAEKFGKYIFGYSWLLSIVVLIIQGWQGGLWGCRKKPAEISTADKFS
jgi:uncharacterized RDD family membrane protein YckC